MNITDLESEIRLAPIKLTYYKNGKDYDAYNGYVAIPKRIIQLFPEIVDEIVTEEVTYNVTKSTSTNRTIGNIGDRIIGFDTLHCSDTPSTCNKDKVIKRTEAFKYEIISLINNKINNSKQLSLVLDIFGKEVNTIYLKSNKIINIYIPEKLLLNDNIFENSKFKIIYKNIEIDSSDPTEILIKNFIQSTKYNDETKLLSYYAEPHSSWVL